MCAVELIDVDDCRCTWWKRRHRSMVDFSYAKVQSVNELHSVQSKIWSHNWWLHFIVCVLVHFTYFDRFYILLWQGKTIWNKQQGKGANWSLCVNGTCSKQRYKCWEAYIISLATSLNSTFASLVTSSDSPSSVEPFVHCCFYWPIHFEWTS